MHFPLAVMLISIASLSADPKVASDAEGNVDRFYGVPIDLAISDLKRLPYSVKMGHSYREGDKYDTATINAEDGVQLNVIFAPNRKLAEVETVSSNAVGPNGVGVGSFLSEVRAAWPGGRLIYGVEENQAFVVFTTGTNVMYSFNPADMPPGTFLHRGSVKEVPDIKVRSIRIADGPVAIPHACIPGYCL